MLKAKDITTEGTESTEKIFMRETQNPTVLVLSF